MKQRITLRERAREFVRYLTSFIRRYGRIADIRDLQEQLLNVQVKVAAIIGVVIYIQALFPVLRKGLFQYVIIYTLALIWMLSIAIFRKLPFLFRVSSWLILLFVFGVVNLHLNGINIDAGLFFFTASLMCALLLGMRFGFMVFALSLFAMAVYGFLIVSNLLAPSMSLPHTDPFKWIIGGSIYLVSGFLSIFSVSSLMRSLVKNLVKTTTLAEDLQQAHDNLSTSEVRFRSLIEYSTDLIAILLDNGEIGFASPSVERLLGYQRAEVIGRNVLEFLHPQDAALVIAALTPGVPREVIGDPVEVRLRHRDGNWRVFEVNGFEQRENPIIKGTVINGRDITERKRIEGLLQTAKDNLESLMMERTAELESASARLKELVAHSPAVIYSTALDGKWNSILVSENILSLLGFSPRQFKQSKGFWKKRIHPEDINWVMTMKGQGSSGKGSTCQYRLRHQDGEYRWIRDDMQVVYSASGQPVELVGSWIDITQQVRAEDATRASQDRHRRLIETMMDAYVRVDMDGRITEFNQAYMTLTGYPADELGNLTYMDLTPNKWHQMEAEIVKTQIVPKGFSDVYEKEYVRKDGRTITVELRTGLTRDSMGNAESMWAIVRDITDRKQRQESILSAKEMLEKSVEERTQELLENREQLRRLTREMISTQEEERKIVSRELHDEAGQLFVTLKHSLDIARQQVEDNQPGLLDRLDSSIGLVDKSMDIMRTISHRLRPPGLEVGGINISLYDLCHEIAGNTNLTIDYQGEDLPGLSSEIAISLYRVVQESLTNILKHAHARRVQVKLKYARKTILLTVEDDGQGIQGISREGTGLLSLQERMRLLGGEIKVESKPGKGVSLHVKIPWDKANPEGG